MNQRITVLIVLALALAVHAQAQPQKQNPRPGPKGREQVMEAAVAYLRGTQAADGAWSKSAHPGITGIVLEALLKSGQVSPDDPMVAKALKVIVSMANPKDGDLALNAEPARHVNYITSVNLAALHAADPMGKKYGALIEKAVAYLKKVQVDEGEGVKPDDPQYGGFGYSPGTRSDMSNTHFAVGALLAAGVSRDDPLFRKLIIYVSRCQNLPSEYNTLPWADKIKDGSFIYTNGAPKGDTPKDAPRPGYGSMTYVGLKALHDCGIGKGDERYKKALEWLSKNYSVDVNPGLPEGSGERGYYYYLVAMTECLDAIGLNEMTDAAGKKHDWRAEVTRALANRQRRDGAWANEIGNWMETNSDLCAAYGIMALSHCKPAGK